ncbi:hypothetical protein HHI36_017607 [Cryptolaemus montrouzieri]|uniref:Uncharacterized protein n=1 Tax=Cryptolaemus montrouzieri TaxID=559131 RepID=A0ABD2NMV9_9CUCU
MLRNHTFVGNYIEQRYVPEFGCYKKIVKISSKEDIFIENLCIAKSRIDRFFAGTKWVGITLPNTLGAPVGYNLWVEIDEEILGTYKFCVRDVLFTKDQIMLNLQVVKPYSKKQKVSSHKLPNTPVEDEGIEVNREILSWKNVKDASVFMFLLCAAIVAGTGQLITFLMDYTLRLLREFSNVIRVITPIFVAFFDTISRMFGYVCFLIALLWRDRHSPPKSQAFYPQKLQYQPAYPYESRYKALGYKPKHSVVITELEE